MGNRMTIEPTEFKNVRSGTSTFGFRAYDDYGSTYCNGMDSIPDDDLDLLDSIVCEFSDEDPMRDMLGDLLDMEKGVDIGGTWYNFCDIKHILEGVKR